MKFAAAPLNILTFGAAVVSTSATTLRRNNNSNNANYHRHLMPEDMECVLYQKDIRFVNGTSEECWSCELTPEQAALSDGVEMVDIVGLTRETIEAKGAVSGETVLKARTAFLEHVDDADTRQNCPSHRRRFRV